MNQPSADNTEVVNTSNKIQQHNLAAMVLEVSAPKAGNVYKGASFEDVTWLDFVASAVVTSPILARASSLGVGKCIYDCVNATELAVASNTNLGMLLLLAPLSPATGSESKDVATVLAALDDTDARLVFQAIALANPGGLGDAEQGDVNDVDALDNEAPVMGLREAMSLAAERDTVARQYANGFKEVFAAADQLAANLADTKLSVDQAIVLTHLQLMAQTPDTLIARKLGLDIASESAQRAQAVVESHWPVGSSSEAAFDSFDDWLRTDGHPRNPGTSADLIAAALFVVLRQGKLELPSAWRENLWS